MVPEDKKYPGATLPTPDTHDSFEERRFIHIKYNKHGTYDIRT